MSEWWTYRLSDFLLFSARTYYRLFELYNAEVWPGQLLALSAGLVLAVVALRGRAWAATAACSLLALGWCWVAWAFHWQRYATINWAAVWFAGAFAVQGLLLLGVAGLHARRGLGVPRGRANPIGLGLLWFGVLGQPWIGVWLGRPWRQAELFGLAPDPTVVATLGLLLLLSPVEGAGPPAPGRAFAWMLWPVPLLWCVVSGATLWALQAPEAWLMPSIGLLAASVAWRAGARGSW